MKYCDECAKEKDYPIISTKISEACDICDVFSGCNDVENPEDKKAAVRELEESLPMNKNLEMVGSMDFRIRLGPNLFEVDYQVSNENNLVMLMYMKALFVDIMNANAAKKSQGAKESDLIHKTQLSGIKKTIALCEDYAKNLAGTLYDQNKHVVDKKVDTPKIEIVSAMKGLKKV